ncbi:MAG: universal stress protein [Haloarculaceae archaeon]
MYEHILLATDGSDHATEAATHAIDAAALHGATLHALYVIETRTAYDNAIVNPDQVRENFREIGEKALEEIAARARAADVELTTTIEEGVPGERILAYIDSHDIDTVYIGERGHSSFKTVLLGSTTERVLHGTDIPVTIV